MDTNNQQETQAFVRRYLTRRGILGSAVAASALLTFGFVKTKEIEAQQLDGNSLYDQLGGMAGITTVIKDFVGIVAADNRINAFFAGTVSQNRVGRLIELLSQQVAEASGGPVTYTGLDMKTAHAGMGISMEHFSALVEDLVMALDNAKVSEPAKMTLLGALAPLAADIVEVDPPNNA